MVIVTRLLIYLTLMVFVIGCQHRESRKNFVARVGDSYLTRETLEALADSTTLSSEPLMREYVARWINNELLYQEARRLGMENTEAFQRQLSEVKKKLAVEALLHKELYNDTTGIPEDSIRIYFDSHREDFLLRQDVVKINIVAFTSREKANIFRAQIVGGTSWRSALEAIQEDTTSQSPVVTEVEGRYYTQQTLFPPELWRVATNLTPGEVSFAIRTQGGYGVIQLLSIKRQGTAPELEIVRDEIHQRLLIERRRQQYADLLARLWSRYEVEVAAR